MSRLFQHLAESAPHLFDALTSSVSNFLLALTLELASQWLQGG